MTKFVRGSFLGLLELKKDQSQRQGKTERVQTPRERERERTKKKNEVTMTKFRKLRSCQSLFGTFVSC